VLAWKPEITSRSGSPEELGGSAASFPGLPQADNGDGVLTVRFLRDILFIVVGLWWCRFMFRRLRRDVGALYDSREIKVWSMIAALWGVTLFVVVCLITSSVGLVRTIGHG
jgi:hypothetical protein